MCVEIGWMEQAVLIILRRFICVVFLVTRIIVDGANHHNYFFECYIINVFRPNVPSITLARMKDSIRSFERNFPGCPQTIHANVGMVPRVVTPSLPPESLAIHPSSTMT